MAAKKRMLLGVVLASLCWAKDPVNGFQLKIVRDHGLPETLQIGDCISGKLYIEDPNHLLTGAGDLLVGATLELPWRGNQDEISAIPAGSYPGTVLEEGDKGWRIKLTGVKNRQNVEVHLGNWPKDSTGCILLGKNLSNRQACFVVNSAQAMSELENLYSSPDHSRPILVSIVGQ